MGEKITFYHYSKKAKQTLGKLQARAAQRKTLGKLQARAAQRKSFHQLLCIGFLPKMSWTFRPPPAAVLIPKGIIALRVGSGILSEDSVTLLDPTPIESSCCRAPSPLV